MIKFFRDVLGFENKESEDTSNVYLVKDGTLFLLYGRNDFENMTHRRYEYIKGLNGHSEMALYVDTFEEVDAAMKYGYDSPDSFTKAFTRFHGITPAQAKNGEGELKKLSSSKNTFINERWI